MDGPAAPRPGPGHHPSPLSDRSPPLCSPDTADPNEQVELAWLDSFLPAIFAIATFGGAITATLIPVDLKAPSTFDGDKVRLFLALAWLFFLLTIALGGVTGLVLGFNRKVIAKTCIRAKGRCWAELTREVSGCNKKCAVLLILWFPISLCLQMFAMSAFLFLGLVVAAYVPGVGWVSFALTLFTMVAAGFAWVAQVCGRKPEK